MVQFSTAVLVQDTVAPDGQTTALHGSCAAISMCVGEWEVLWIHTLQVPSISKYTTLFS